MSVVSVKERTEGQRSWKTTEGREHRRVFVVILNDVTDGAQTARLAAGVPDIGDAHPGDATAKAYRVDPQGTASSLAWYVYVDYRRPTHKTKAEDPLDDPVQIEWGFRTVSAVLEKDRNGNGILNSAGEPFDPPLEDDVHILTLTVTRNEPTFSANTANNYVNTVNSGTVTLCGLQVTARQAKLSGCSAQSAERNGVNYCIVRYQLEFKVATWDRDVLDQGIREWIDAGDHSKGLKQIKGPDGEYVMKPVKLNGNGRASAATADATYLTFECNTLKDFSTLNLNI